MKLETAQDLVHFLFNEGYEAELYSDYSGRGMYGKTTVGVTTDCSFGTMESLEESLEEVEIDPDFRRDSMGKSYIYY